VRQFLRRNVSFSIRRVFFATGFFLLTLGVRAGVAQIVPLYDVLYRPPGVGYLILPGDHFDIIYQWGLREQAEETLNVLESSLVFARECTCRWC
jgi:hypothetical protein